MSDINYETRVAAYDIVMEMLKRAKEQVLTQDIIKDETVEIMYHTLEEISILVDKNRPPVREEYTKTFSDVRLPLTDEDYKEVNELANEIYLKPRFTGKTHINNGLDLLKKYTDENNNS